MNIKKTVNGYNLILLYYIYKNIVYENNKITSIRKSAPICLLYEIKNTMINKQND